MADGTDVEILNWLDDHSRYLLYCTAFHRVGGPDIVASFTDVVNTYGLPASTLTDNGSVYTSRFTHGHNDFERLLASLGVTQKNADVTQLQTLLDTFRELYNNRRPHRALPEHRTPTQAYTALPKANPPSTPTATTGATNRKTPANGRGNL